MLINIWVRDNSTGEIHQLGTDTHDSLIVLDGQVQYENLQNGCGTLEAYSFVECPCMDDYILITPEELFLNRAYLDERLYNKFIVNRPPAKTEARREYNEKCIRKANEILKKIKGFFTS